MSLMETIAAIRALNQDISDQLQYIDGFQRETKEHLQLIQAEFAGSASGHDQRMISDIQAVDAALERARGELERASDALLRVQTV